MGYLVTQIVLCLLAAFLLGLFLGWLLWSRRQSSDGALADARARVTALETALADCRATTAPPDEA